MISLSKTEVMHQPAPGTSAPPPNVSIEGTELKVVEQFKYLGSTISCDGSLDKEIAQRISKASQSLGRLRTRVINNKNIKLETKIKVYKAVVLTSLLYGCETWTTYRKYIKQLERFHMRSLRSIMHIKWQDRVTNLAVLDRAGLVSIETMIMKAQLRWSGHLIRMDSTRLPRQVFYGVLSQGQRNTGRPKKRYKDCIKDSLKYCGIPPAQLEAQAQNRVGWCAAVKKGCKSFEDHRRGKVAAARQRRKEAATAPPTASFPCPNCPRAAIGSKALDMAREEEDQNFVKFGLDVLTLAVLAILITAPIGALGIGLAGPRLLDRQVKGDEPEGGASTSSSDGIGQERAVTLESKL
ncbi:Sodium/hydrogen exchanger 9B2 [Takifugu flavidus]|uniref:Sodium/hydrogen exchanger 9B2 n=1 Tax=Takifugu flavidus TaxID=433684 RepID=A0A5C6NA10_9TELE|nr:Sodium/hydrogen exchanger 9B2 [Takifugu flavidus]